MLLPLILIGTPVSVAGASITTPHHILAADGESWKASVIGADCLGETDGAGHPWYAPEFNDSAWSPVQLPDLNTIPSNQDRFYRMQYTLVGTSPTKVRLLGDDGAWLYVNGREVDHWGGGCHGAARAGDQLIDISPYLHAGSNTIAVHVSNGPAGSLFDLDMPPRIILPADSKVMVNFISASTDCTGEFGLSAPTNTPIYTDYLYHQGISFALEPAYAAATDLIFYIKPRSFCGNQTFLSTDPSRAQIQRIDDVTWHLRWEDWVDADFNDLVVEIRLTGTVVPFLSLPFDYSKSFKNFTQAVSDTERSGSVQSYFDHHYPTYAQDDYVVTFHGYDSSKEAGFNLAYDGHDGIDFDADIKAPGREVEVLAAAEGRISSIITADTGLGNHVVLTHPNGYQTIYGHLARFDTSITKNMTVDRGRVLGIMGSTGKSTGTHIHFGDKNPAGIVVDPFSWIPFEGSTYQKKVDPWVEKNAPVDAKSTYLWIQPLDRHALNSKDALTTITSASGSLRAVFPVNAAPTSYRIDLWHNPTNSTPSNPTGVTLGEYALFAYDRQERPIWILQQPVQLTFSVSSLQGSSLQAAQGNVNYQVYMWEATYTQWRSLPSVYDPQTGLLTSGSTRLGRIMVVQQGGSTFLPGVMK